MSKIIYQYHYGLLSSAEAIERLYKLILEERINEII